ncbi:hypothetical protein [Mycobacterium sp. TY814]|uniref:hypothetical protein n=1 Tax=Mycobacterium sp. TY814 TaxID=3050580 RepID=UPI0027405E8C|nr:hypothetical protein [Mycobacterium sp. TY814]MDP7721810.1 hypothetical protein [Mycobacterium sp. TY814]
MSDRLDIACADQPRESDPCAIRDGSTAAPDGNCVTCGKHTGPAASAPFGYPTSELETPAPDREPKIAEAVARLHVLNSQLEVFHGVRRIAENQALLSSAAVKQIRALYTAFDEKHPTPAQEGGQQ